MTLDDLEQTMRSLAERAQEPTVSHQPPQPFEKLKPLLFQCLDLFLSVA